MKKNMAEYISKCLTYQQVKAEHQAPVGKLRPLSVLVWKWERIMMDFVSGLPKTPRKNYAIWVIVDRLTKSSHFLPIRWDSSLEYLAKEYVNQIVRLHRVQCPLYQTRIHSLHLAFGRVYMKLWVLN